MSECAPCILLVDDSPENRESVTRALRKAGYEGAIRTCADGDEALDFLYRRGRFREPGSAPRPSLILLDLNLPGTDGLAVLSAIKRSHSLKPIPVIMLTTSLDPRDVARCYRAGANSYVQKMMDVARFQKIMRSLKEFWIDTVVYPFEDRT